MRGYKKPGDKKHLHSSMIFRGAGVDQSLYIVCPFVHFLLLGPGWLNELDYLTTHTSLSPIGPGFTPDFVNYKNGALESQPQVIKFTSCLSMVGSSFQVLRLLPPLKLVAMI